MAVDREKHNTVRRLEVEQMINLARSVATKFDHAVTAPRFRPLAYRWADALVLQHRPASLIEDYLQWSDNLLSEMYHICWGMQSLITPESVHRWSPLAYYTWFLPEWFYLFPALLPEEAARFTREEEGDEQIPFVAMPEMPFTSSKAAAPRPGGGQDAILPLKSGTSLSAELMGTGEDDRAASEQGADFAMATPARGSRPAKKRRAERLDRAVPVIQDTISGMTSIGHGFPKRYLAPPESDIASVKSFAGKHLPWLKIPRIFLPQTLPSTHAVDEVVRKETRVTATLGEVEKEKGNSFESFPSVQDTTIATASARQGFPKPSLVPSETDIASLRSFGAKRPPWLNMPRIFLPQTLPPTRAIGEAIRKKMRVAATLGEVEKEKGNSFEGVPSVQDTTGDTTSVRPTFPKPYLVPPGTDITSLRSFGAKRLPWFSMPRIFLPQTLAPRHAVSEAVGEETWVSAIPSDAGERKKNRPENLSFAQDAAQNPSIKEFQLASPHERAIFDIESEETRAFACPRTLPLLAPKTPRWLVEAEKAPGGLAEGYAPEIPVVQPIKVGTRRSSWAENTLAEERPPDWGLYYEESLSLSLVPQTLTYPGEADLSGLAGGRQQTDHNQLAAQFAGQCQANSPKPGSSVNVALAPLDRPRASPASPPGTERTTSPEEQRRQGLAEADPDVLAREVYDIIKHRLLVEREQAHGMV